MRILRQYRKMRTEYIEMHYYWDERSESCHGVFHVNRDIMRIRHQLKGEGAGVACIKDGGGGGEEEGKRIVWKVKHSKTRI